MIGPHDLVAVWPGAGITELEPGLWLVTDPSATERLLANKDAMTTRADQGTIATSWGPAGLSTWMDVRRAMRPLLAAARISGTAPAIADQAEQIIRDWPSDGILDAMGEAVRLVSAVNIRHMLGEPSPALTALVERELTLAGRAGPVFRRRRLRTARHATYTAIRDHVRASTTGLPAVLTDRGFAEHTVTLAVRNMLLSSHHVPAAALAWIFRELSTHPEVQDRARAEAVAHREPTGDLPLCRAVVLEALRLHPPVWQLQRRLSAPAHGLPEGATLLFSPYLNHRDHHVYTDPERFHPARWHLGFHPAPGSYLPFALGPRTCPASRLALLELTVLVAAVLGARRLVPHRSPTTSRSVLHAPRNLQLRVLPTGV